MFAAAAFAIGGGDRFLSLPTSEPTLTLVIFEGGGCIWGAYKQARWRIDPGRDDGSCNVEHPDIYVSGGGH